MFISLRNWDPFWNDDCGCILQRRLRTVIVPHVEQIHLHHFELWQLLIIRLEVLYSTSHHISVHCSVKPDYGILHGPVGISFSKEPPNLLLYEAWSRINLLSSASSYGSAGVGDHCCLWAMHSDSTEVYSAPGPYSFFIVECLCWVLCKHCGNLGSALKWICL